MRPLPSFPQGVISTLVGTGLALGVTGCSKRTAPAPPPGTAVDVVAVAAPSGESTIRATGTVSRTREAVLSFRIPGIMSNLAVDVGDQVRAGQQIATIDAQDTAARLTQTRAEFTQATADLARLEGLVEAGAVSRQQYDAARTRVATARAANQSAVFDSRSARLISPVSGVVLARAAQRGEVVQPGQAIITLADTASALVLRVPVADRDVGRIRIGSIATMEADALGARQISGRVSRIGAQSGSQSGAIDVEITLPAGSGLRSGTVASARIAVSPATGVGSAYARVPAEAILEANGTRAFVMRYDTRAQVARRTAVTFGGFDGDDALISGLTAGARVIAGGAGYVADGDRVTINTPAP